MASLFFIGSFKKILNKMKVEVLFSKKQAKGIGAFCIVHWNAPDFLLLNVRKIVTLHPESKVYVFDNNSAIANLDAALHGLEKYDNTTLFSIKGDYWRFASERMQHILGLQFLLNYSAMQSDAWTVFLDQDCILSSRVDSLLTKLDSRKTLLIGARDYVEIPKDYGPLKKGALRELQFRNTVHASFMMMQPTVIHGLFGSDSLITDTSSFRSGFELYHGISFKASGRILFLDTQMHDEIPLLTRYTFQGRTYAWHCWYSSRTVGMQETDMIDNLPVSWVRDSLKQAYEFIACMS
jgi:hypothetical protein